MKFIVFSELEDAQGDKDNRGHTIDTPFDAQSAVLEACTKFWDENDGWEWMKTGCTLYSKDEDGVILKHVIGPPDFDPVFYAPEGEPI